MVRLGRSCGSGAPAFQIEPSRIEAASVFRKGECAGQFKMAEPPAKAPGLGSETLPFMQMAFRFQKGLRRSHMHPRAVEHSAEQAARGACPVEDHVQGEGLIVNALEEAGIQNGHASKNVRRILDSDSAFKMAGSVPVEISMPIVTDARVAPRKQEKSL